MRVSRTTLIPLLLGCVLVLFLMYLRWMTPVWSTVSTPYGKARVILSRIRGSIEAFPSSVKVPEDEWYMYQGHPTEPARLHWSDDDERIFYSFDGASYMFDLRTGKEHLLRSDRGVISSSSYSPVLVTRTWDGSKFDYYILDLSGGETWFAAGPSLLRVLKWLDPVRFIYSNEGKCYVHDISTGKSTFISTGVAFDYDPSSNRVFILVTLK